jgi:hypothetical protein
LAVLGQVIGPRFALSGGTELALIAPSSVLPVLGRTFVWLAVLNQERRRRACDAGKSFRVIEEIASEI